MQKVNYFKNPHFMQEVDYLKNPNFAPVVGRIWIGFHNINFSSGSGKNCTDQTGSESAALLVPR
jgi:hypothetical protein